MFSRIPLCCVIQFATVLVSIVLEAESFHGRIVMVTDNKVVVATTSEQRTVVVAAATQITLDGKPAKLEQLSAGVRAMIVAEKSRDDFVAKTIAAMSAK
jgi:hypothetical protein